MDNTTSSLPPIKVFISYAKEDDAAFDFAGPLKSTLKQLISGLSGRNTEVFLDRDDIPLGENWQARLENGVRSSLVLIAVYTGNYPRRAACREEFFLFLEQSKALDVQNLLIPVVWLGFESLLTVGEDEISDYVRAHQAADFKDAWVEGSSSAPFRRNVLKIAERVLQVTAQVEETLAAKELDTFVTSTTHSPSVEDSVDENTRHDWNQDRDTKVDSEEDDDGLIELSEKITADLETMTLEASSLGEAMVDLGNLPDPPEGAQLSPTAATQYMIRVAGVMKQPSLSIEEHGAALFHATRQCDASLRSLIRVAETSGSQDIKASLYKSLAPNVMSLAELSTVDEQLTSFLEKIRGPEALSASVRKSVRPARRGVTAVRDALSLISDWPSLIESINTDPAGEENI